MCRVLALDVRVRHCLAEYFFFTVFCNGNFIVPHFSFGFVITDYIMNSGSVLAKSVCTIKDTEDTAALEHTEMAPPGP